MPICSFCGKTSKEVRWLITGPQVAICNECISLSNQVIAELDLESKLNEVRELSFNEFWQGA